MIDANKDKQSERANQDAEKYHKTQIVWSEEEQKRMEKVERLDKRIKWVRQRLEEKITTEQSSDFQWLLMHLISIEDGTLDSEFKIHDKWTDKHTKIVEESEKMFKTHTEGEEVDI